jgi:hypothetical protein
MSIPNERAAPRRIQCHRAKLCSPLIGVPVDCELRDMSASGARLKLAAELSFHAISWPKDLTLQIPIDRVEVDCILVRRRNHELGVQFASTFRRIQRPIMAA